MNDFETRLRDVLNERSTHAPDASGLAAGARRRLRRRRTTWAVAAAAVAAGAVPLVLGQVAGTGGDNPPAAEPGEVTNLREMTEEGYRAESWHYVSFEVPVDWGYGSGTAWCTTGSTPDEVRPVVTRPDTVAAAVSCSPTTGYGVTISGSRPGDQTTRGRVWQVENDGAYPEAAWLGQWSNDDVEITVVTPDRAMTERVVQSVQYRRGIDNNGCPTLKGNAEATFGGVADSLSICHYDGGGLLTASRRLFGADAVTAAAVIFSTPPRAAEVDCPDEKLLPGTVILDADGYAGEVVTDAACAGHNGVFLPGASGEVREVDDAVRRKIDLTRLP